MLNKAVAWVVLTVASCSVQAQTNAPSVTNLPPTNIVAFSATFNGQVLSTGNETPVVRLYYGTSDGGTNPVAWSTNFVLGPQTNTFSQNISGLSPQTSYYYTAQASNSAGVVWASPSESFTTRSAPVISNAPPTGILGTSATFNGQVLSIGDETPLVTLYYGANDGGTNAFAWARNVSLGPQTNTFSQLVSDLAGSTTYFYTAQASNSAGVVWASPSESFATLSAPVISNAPPTNVLYTSATLSGKVLSIGQETPVVTLFYGPTYGGTDPAAWSNNVVLGPQAGTFSQVISGLSSNTTYYCTAQATNNTAVVWGTPLRSFRTRGTHTNLIYNVSISMATSSQNVIPITTNFFVYDIRRGTFGTMDIANAIGKAVGQGTNHLLNAKLLFKVSDLGPSRDPAFILRSGTNDVDVRGNLALSFPSKYATVTSKAPGLNNTTNATDHTILELKLAGTFSGYFDAQGLCLVQNSSVLKGRDVIQLEEFPATITAALAGTGSAGGWQTLFNGMVVISGRKVEIKDY